MKRLVLVLTLLVYGLSSRPVWADQYCGGSMVCPNGSPRLDPVYNNCQPVDPVGCVPQYGYHVPHVCHAVSSPLSCTYTNSTYTCRWDDILNKCVIKSQTIQETDCCPGTIYTCTSATAPVCNGTCPSGQSCKPNSGNSACVCQSNGPRQPDVYAIFQVLEDTNNDNIGEKLVYSTGGPVCSALNTMSQAQPFSVLRKHLTNMCNNQIGAGTKDYHTNCSVGPNIGAEASYKFDNSTQCCTYQSSSGQTRQDCASQDREYWLDALKDASGNYYVTNLGTGMRDQFDIVGYSSNCSHKWGAMICENYSAASGMYDCGQDKCVRDQVYVRRKTTYSPPSCQISAGGINDPTGEVTVSWRGTSNGTVAHVPQRRLGLHKIG